MFELEGGPILSLCPRTEPAKDAGLPLDPARVTGDPRPQVDEAR